jgi:hypothetical protein
MAADMHGRGFVPYFGYILDDTALVLQKYSNGVPAAVGEAFPDFGTSTTKMAMFRSAVHICAFLG